MYQNVKKTWVSARDFDVVISTFFNFHSVRSVIIIARFKQKAIKNGNVQIQIEYW